MERRNALKNMGMVFGYAVTTPTLIGLVQSCNSKKVLDWTPSFFTKDEGVAIHTLVDIILPKTDTPSATEANVHVFIDQFAKEVLPKMNSDFLKLGMDVFFNKALADTQKENLGELNEEDFTPMLTKYLKKQTPDVEKAQREAINAYFKAVRQNGSAVLDDEIACRTFIGSLRDTAVWAYKNSELVGEEVLAYLPIPGEYVPCEDIDTLTNGKAWSLS